MLQALYERGIAPDVLVGTSGGALNAAFVASRPQTTATSIELGRVWRNLQHKDVFPTSISAVVGGMSGRRDHLVPDRGLRQLIRRYIEFEDLADAPIPLHVVAFDLTECRELLLSDGPAVDSVLASGAIPGVFAPVAIGERRLIDGGVLNNTPISHAVELGAERIYVLPTLYPRRPLARVPKSALEAAIYGLALLLDSRLESDIARCSQEVELIVLPAPNTTAVQPASFDHSVRLMNEALLAARRLLATQTPTSAPLRRRTVTEPVAAVRTGG